MTTLLDVLCFIVAAMLLPVAWNWPRLRTVPLWGRRMELFMFIAIGSLALAVLLRNIR